MIYIWLKFETANLCLLSFKLLSIASVSPGQSGLFTSSDTIIDPFGIKGIKFFKATRAGLYKSNQYRLVKLLCIYFFEITFNRFFS